MASRSTADPVIGTKGGPGNVAAVWGVTWVLGLSGQSLRKLYKCLATMLYT